MEDSVCACDAKYQLVIQTLTPLSDDCNRVNAVEADVILSQDKLQPPQTAVFSLCSTVNPPLIA